VNTLDRYITKEFLKIFVFILFAIVSVYLIIDFFGKIRMFMSNSATVYQMASHFFFMIPMIVSQTTPAVILLATLMTFGTLSRHNEIAAVKANGISLYRLASPVLVLVFAICLLLFFFSEFVTPRAYERAERIRVVEVQKQKELGAFKQNQIWYRGSRGIYNFRLFEAETDTLHGVTINYLDQRFNLFRRIDAEKAQWRTNRWIARNALVTTFDHHGFPSLTTAAEQALDLTETPADFKVVQKDADKMGFFDLRRYISKLQSEGYDATRYLADLHGKVAMSFVGILLVVIGICFSLRSERSGGAAQSIAAGVVIGFSYWLLFAFALSLGRSGTLPPLLAAWTANLVFTVVALFLLRRIHT
jgi:lipopolysaccharide export system permease protein